jgi:ABC-type transport system substrate-binding protein
VTYNFDLYIETEPANVAPTWLYYIFSGVNNIYPVPLSTNLVGYNNSTFNECTKQLMAASNSDAAKMAAFKCQEELSLDLPALPVYSRNLLLVEQRASFNITPIRGSIPDTIAVSLANMTGGSLVRIGEVGGLMDINPATELGAAISLALRLITKPLLTCGSDGSPQPGLIDRWQIGDNATNLTLNLSQDSEFQDGSPTTAHDLAATLNWLVTNTLPSTPLYPILKTIRSVSEVDAYTLRISLRQSNYFAAYEIGGLFALPANSLPQGNGPLTLLLSGALQSSGPFELARFVQGAEVDLRYALPAGGTSMMALSGVQGQDLLGASLGGSQIQIPSQALNYGGQSIENATFTVLIHEGNSTTEIPGAHVGFGLYRASLNLNGANLSPGNHVVTTQLYAQLPTGVILQFNQQELVVLPPHFLGQVVVYLIALVAAGFIAYGAIHPKGKKIPRKRVRRARRTRVRRPRRRR